MLALNRAIHSCVIVPCGPVIATLFAALFVFPAMAQTVMMPQGATLVRADEAGVAHYRIALGPVAGQGDPHIMASGAINREIWQIPEFGGTTAELMAMLQMQFENDGFTPLFSCADRDCGGFDFRFAIDVGQAPAMYVDLGDFAYLSAERVTDVGDEYAALMVSRGGGRAYVHLTRVAPPSALGSPVAVSSRAPDTADVMPEDFDTTLVTNGRAILDDLRFETGASALSADTYPSLVSLASFLAENSTAQVVLVGHTDAEGSLEANIGLSRARAVAVRQLLITELGVRPDQVGADGVGYLSPRAANTDAGGRQANRRVEVVLTRSE